MKIECSLNITCPRRWDELEIVQTGQESACARHCLECGQNVVLCQTQEAIAQARIDGKCVAYPAYLEEVTRY